MPWGFPAPAVFPPERDSSIGILAQTVGGGGLGNSNAYSQGVDVSVYPKPNVDLDAVYTYQDGYAETGTYGLSVASHGKWSFAASPNIEIGGRHNFESGETLRLYGRLGMTVMSSDDWKTSAAFINSPAPGNGFATSLDYANTFALVAAGSMFESDLLPRPRSISLCTILKPESSVKKTRRLDSKPCVIIVT
ncbi:autotransporter outer membrane beta-barrel domain-containing protein [Martelella lutilitoris]|uniref:Autotransporter outer membrane beta-barrel domain-containing protein n=1 Tax=Martelella lutilitoris TaxID=2583532 RepID=A0A5C4JTU8_9HYPH|nr:autotransporter outer membrane beta-barrel domain-containing protein [Martelella lutilitoris]TNB48843.1 autotransporter outer membrane beta-barrel domain-containing protein [Martelella lutilitoris]